MVHSPSHSLCLIEPLEARIVPSATGVLALQSQLNIFAAEKGAAFLTLTTAKADDLVYAVYQLTKTPAWDEPAEVSDLLTSALEPVFDKARKDRDTLAPRLLAAALVDTGITDGTEVAGIVSAVADANGATGFPKFKLTAKGKEAVVAKALQVLSDGPDSTAGADIGALVKALSSAAKGATPELKLQDFTIEVLKLTGRNTGQLGPFMERVLEDATDKKAFATNVAAAVAASRGEAAGAALGAYAKTLPEDEAIRTLANESLRNAKLSKAQIPIIASLAAEYGEGPAQFVTEVLAAIQPEGKRTLSLRAAIASGVLQTVSAGEVAEVIDAALAGKTLKPADLPAFTEIAAVGTGELAGEVVAKMIAVAATLNPSDPAQVPKVGIAALKAIAVTAPEAGYLIAQELIDAGGTLFDTDEELKTLAQNLATAVPNIGPATGAAIAGVASRLDLRLEGPIAQLGADAILKAPESATAIAEKLAEEFRDAAGPGANYSSFAASLALFSPTNAPAIAAGVAKAAIADSTVTGGQPTGQDAGDIVVAVIRADFSTHQFEKRAFTIARTVASVVDVERIADIGNRVAALYVPGGGGAALPKLPKFSSIDLLATALAKAINTKPGISTANRVDELGELTAELTRQAIAVLGPDSPALEETLVDIGRGVAKGLSSKLLINGGAFPADAKDAAAEIAGALAQTISVGVVEGRLTSVQATALLGADGKIVETLVAKEKKVPADITAAFTKVRDAAGEPNRLYVDADPAKNEPVSNRNSGGTLSATARYEIGSVVDETALIFIP